jgi:hypothetical protein
MKAASVAFAVVAIAAAGLLAPAHAQERMVPLAINGDWGTLAHQAGLLSRPDMCLTGNMSKGFMIRADRTNLQIRMNDQRWSLPTGVEGTITIVVGDWKHTFEIDDNTAVEVNAEIARTDLIQLLDAMDKASMLFVVVGNAKPVSVSLAGSTIVTNAFRTCAGLRGSLAAPGSNPFE